RSTSSPKKPNTGQAPTIRKKMPAVKLMPPSTSMKIKKPSGPSDRCGVGTGEKIVGSGGGALSGGLPVDIGETRGPKTPKKATKRTAKRATQRRVRQSLKKAGAGKAAAVKGGRQREAADRKADAGALPQWTPAEVEEAFRRFQAAMPAPETELEHVD